MQTVSLRHFGGGNEVQVVTFGPGYAPVSRSRPLSVDHQRGAERDLARRCRGDRHHGHDRDRAPHTLQVGDESRSPASAIAGYNGTFTVTAVPTTRSFQYTNPVTGLPRLRRRHRDAGCRARARRGRPRRSGRPARTAARSATSSSISGVGVGGYNGTFTITAVPTPRTFQYTIATPAGELRRRDVDLLLAVPGAHRRQRLRPSSAAPGLRTPTRT